MKTNYIKPILISALAAPLSANAINLSDYKPTIEYKKVRTSTSLYGCKIEDYVLSGQDPVTKEKRNLSFSLYKPKRAVSTKASVIILPPTGGVNVLDQGYSNEICSSGVSALLISKWDHEEEKSLDFTMHNNGALRYLTAVKHSIEFLEQHESKSIGILGTSIGAIGALLSFSNEKRIKAGAFIVGSARFSDVIAHSDERGATALRNARMKEFNFKNVDEYSKALRDNIPFEPANFLKENDQRKTLIVTANADTTVPTDYQEELVQTLNPEVHIELNGDHRQVIKDTFFWQRSKIVTFFSKNL